MTASVPYQALLAETRWLSGLARQLVAHGPDADDLVQDTLCQAVETPPSDGGSLRGWLRTVLVHRWRDQSRARRTRLAREVATASRRHEPSAAELVVKAETQRELVDVVLTLDEPYRACVLMRFFENLPPREIARRLGVPVATVNSRLQRALARMRGQLDRRHGPQWGLALAPLLSGRSPATLFVGASIVNVIPKLFVGAAAIALALLAWNWIFDPSAVAPVTDAVAATPARTAVDDDPATSGTGGQLARTAVAAADEPATATEPVDESVILAGRVIDVQGVAVPDVALQFGAGAQTKVRSGSDGTFRFPRSAGSDRVVAEDPRWATVLAGSTRIERDQRCVVIVAPRIAIAGRVVDGFGGALADAAVQVHLPAHLGADLGVLLDYSLAMTWRVSCDESGGFVLRDVPAVAAASLSASLGGYEPRFVDMPPASTDRLQFVLDRTEAGAGVVDGIVLDRYGAAVQGARVSDGRDVSRTDARGAFRIDVADDPGLGRLVAIAPGMQPAKFEPPVGADGKPRWPARVMLYLGEPPLSVRGRVVDRRGEAVAGARVWIGDPLMVGVEQDTLLAENLLAGDAERFWSYVETAADGTYRLDGLLDRRYELRALHPGTLVETVLSGVAAGSTDVELRLDAATHDELRGRVVARDGTAIPDVIVKLQRPALEVEVPGGTRDTWAAGTEQRTDADGAFRFENVPTRGVEVFAVGDQIQFAGRMVERDSDPSAFDIVVDRRVHLQVEIDAPTERVDRVRVLDADGKRMRLRVMRGQSAYTNMSAAVLKGRTEVLSLGEGARTIVFLKAGEEVFRMPVHLRPGDVNQVRY